MSQTPNSHEEKAVYINESRLLFELIQTFSKITRPLIFEKLLKVMYIFIDKKIISGVGCVTNTQLSRRKSGLHQNVEKLKTNILANKLFCLKASLSECSPKADHLW